MKFITSLAILLASATSFANQTWNDLEIGKKYHLASDIAFTEQLKLNQGDALVLEDIIAMQVPVLYLAFRNLTCTDSALKAEMVLFNPEPEDTDHDKSIGVELDPDCIVGMYVEPKFWYDKSAFE